MKRMKTVTFFAVIIMLGSLLSGCAPVESVDPLDEVYKNDREEITLRELFEGSEEVLGNANYLHVTGSCHSDSPVGQKDDNKFDYKRHYTDDDNYEDVLTGNYESSSIASIFSSFLGCESRYEYICGKKNGADVQSFTEHSLDKDGFTLRQNMVEVDVRNILFPDLSGVMFQFSGQPRSGYYYVTLRGDLSCFNGSFGRSMGGSSNINEVIYSFSTDTHVLEKVTVTGEKREMKEYIKGKQTELIYKFRAEFNVEEADYE